MKKTICDFCGKEFDLWDTQEDFGFSYRVGYGRGNLTSVILT